MNLPFLFVKLLLSVANFRLHFRVICERTADDTVNEKCYVRKLIKDMTFFKGATSRFADLEKSSLVFEFVIGNPC